MKTSLLFSLFLLGLTPVSFCQISLEFSATELFITGSPDSFETIGHAFITNKSSDSVSLRWVREEIDFPDNWRSGVCDKNQCYPSHIFTNIGMIGNIPTNNPILLNSGDTSIIDVHLYPEQNRGTGKVRVCITEVSDPDNILGCINYDFKLGVSSTKDFSKNALKVYPNPTFDFFNLQNAEGVGFVKVYNTLGRLVKVFDASFEKNFYVGDLPSGMYLINMQSKNGKNIKTTRIVKKSLMP